MNANELRLGNHIKVLDTLNETEHFVIVNRIYSEDSITANYYRMINFSEIDEYGESNLHIGKPIPLTDEFINKNSLISFSAEYNYAHISFLKDDNGKWFGILTDIDGQKIGKPCYYVHEIQNLYYSVEHKELVIK